MSKLRRPMQIGFENTPSLAEVDRGPLAVLRKHLYAVDYCMRLLAEKREREAARHGFTDVRMIDETTASMEQLRFKIQRGHA